MEGTGLDDAGVLRWLTSSGLVAAGQEASDPGAGRRRRAARLRQGPDARRAGRRRAHRLRRGPGEPAGDPGRRSRRERPAGAGPVPDAAPVQPELLREPRGQRALTGRQHQGQHDLRGAAVRGVRAAARGPRGRGPRQAGLRLPREHLHDRLGRVRPLLPLDRRRRDLGRPGPGELRGARHPRGQAARVRGVAQGRPRQVVVLLREPHQGTGDPVLERPAAGEHPELPARLGERRRRRHPGRSVHAVLPRGHPQGGEAPAPGQPGRPRRPRDGDPGTAAEEARRARAAHPVRQVGRPAASLPARDRRRASGLDRRPRGAGRPTGRRAGRSARGQAAGNVALSARRHRHQQAARGRVRHVRQHDLRGAGLRRAEPGHRHARGRPHGQAVERVLG